VVFLSNHFCLILPVGLSSIAAGNPFQSKATYPVPQGQAVDFIFRYYVDRYYKSYFQNYTIHKNNLKIFCAVISF